MNYRNICITGTGKYLPDRILTSLEIDSRLGKEKGWTEDKSGVRERRFANDDETTSFMAAKAAEQALENAGLALAELDCIVGSCGVMEQPIPCTASLVQKQLGLQDTGITAFDINSTCLSFLSALDTISYMVSAKRFKNVLVFSSDIPSLGLNWDDTDSCTIFGDGAAAVIISTASEKNYTQIHASRMETYSKGSEFCQLQAGGTRLHPSRFKGNLNDYALFEMNGKAAYKLAANITDELCEKLLSDTKLTMGDIDLVIPHQASKLSMHHLIKRLHIPEEKLVNIYHNHGNQVAASMPTALHEAVITNRIKQGDKVLLIGTGAGISVGGMIMEYNQC
ncbi:MAG: beta-ketoacyl-ACP synthase III [Pseudomonadota bacterium]